MPTYESTLESITRRSAVGAAALLVVALAADAALGTDAVALGTADGCGTGSWTSTADATTGALASGASGSTCEPQALKTPQQLKTTREIRPPTTLLMGFRSHFACAVASDVRRTSVPTCHEAVLFIAGEIETIVGATSVEPSGMRHIARCHGETGRNVALGGWMRAGDAA